MHKTGCEDTIVALSTPIGEGGIGIVRLSGPEALAIADEIFISKDGEAASAFKTYTVHYGHIIDTRQSKTDNQKPKAEIIDEVLVTVMRAPKSYTKEDIVEINCHGGIQAAKRVIDLTVRHGARVAEPGEFTKRAFLNGRIDLAQAEAVLDIIRAKTERSLKVAIGQLEGALSQEVSRIRSELIGIASHIEASIDFPEEELDIIEGERLLNKAEAIVHEIERLRNTFNEGAVLREGVLAVICGKPNVGKSSLMNLLLKRDRVIVAPIPGTTRDAIEEIINLKGVPIRLVDTAGIVEAKDILEHESIRRSKRYVEEADIAVLVLDASTAIEKEDTEIIRLLGDRKKLVVLNKIDGERKTYRKDAEPFFKNDIIVEVSVERKQNIELLEKAVLDMVWGGEFVQGEGAIVANARHKELLDKAHVNMISVSKALHENLSPELIAVDIKEAVFNLGLIIGASVSDDILQRIFEDFCIGK